MDFIKQNLKTIILVTVLIIGLVVAIVLVQTKQVFKSRASTEGLKVSSDQGEVQREDDGTFSTDSNSIRIEINDLEKLR